MTTNDDVEADADDSGSSQSAGQPIILGGYLDLKKLERIVAGENRRRAECHAGQRPWLVPPGTNASVPLGIAGSTPEEAQQRANLEASMEQLRAEGWPHYPGVRFPLNHHRESNGNLPPSLTDCHDPVVD